MKTTVRPSLPLARPSHPRQSAPTRTVRQSGPVVARFTATWLWLDRSMARHVWPYLLGAAIAGGAIAITQSVVISSVFAFGAFGVLYYLGRRASAYEEAMRKTSD